MRLGIIFTLSVLLLSGCLCSLPTDKGLDTSSNETANVTTTLVQPSTTAATQTTTASTSSSTLRTTTSTMRKASTTSTTSSLTTSTTEKPGGCQSDVDCKDKTFKECSNNNVMLISVKYSCVQSPDGSYCLGKEKRSIDESCSGSEYCVNETCKRKIDASGVTASSITTSTSTIKYSLPTISTTTDTIPPATTCMGRSASGSARSESDCDSLPCGRVGGGRTYTCQYIPGEGDTGHCACK